MFYSPYIIITRILVQVVPELKSQVKDVVWHIPHQYQYEMSQKSKVVCNYIIHHSYIHTSDNRYAYVLVILLCQHACQVHVQSTLFNPSPRLSQCCNHLVTELFQGGYNLGNGLKGDGLNKVDYICTFHHNQLYHKCILIIMVLFQTACIATVLITEVSLI